MDACCICKESTGSLVKVTERGIKGLITFSKLRKHQELEICLHKCLEESKPVHVHEECRKWFNNKRRIENDNEIQTEKKKTRKSTEGFNWKKACFICSKECSFDPKNPSRKNWHLASTFQIKTNTLETCKSRLQKDNDDKLALEVQSRISNCIDFIAAEARYHTQCMSLFKSEKKFERSKQNKGRPKDDLVSKAFEEACDWLEEEIDIITVAQFEEKVKEIAQTEEVHGRRYLKQMLKDKYKGHILFSEQPGLETLIYFHDMANFIINKKFVEKKDSVEDEAKRIIKAAANLIRAEIRDMQYDTNSYPTSSEITGDWAPKNLRSLLSHFTKSNLRQESIAQCIVKAVSPKTLPPLLFGLGIEVDHLYGSKWLSEELFRLGFSISYREITKYKQASATFKTIEEEIKALTNHGGFTQFVADNVDHNIATLDGHGTFHGMGIIASTVGGHQRTSEVKIKRPQNILSTADLLTKLKGIPIVPYDFPKSNGLSQILFKPRAELMYPFTLPSSITADSIWKAADLKLQSNRRPNWSGYMKKISEHEHPKHQITFLPIIDLNPTDMTCIYSTLLFIMEQSKKLGMMTASITFDQPLWLKAYQIAKEKSLKVFLHLGGFHTLMSFLGSIGYFMADSGIETALQTVYGENAVKHMLSGKAIARALRGHFIVDSALTMKLHQKLVVEEIKEDSIQQFKMNEDDLLEIENACSQVYEETSTLEEVNIKAVKKLDSGTEALKRYFSQESRTGKLWIQYMECIDIIRNYIRAARTSDWNLYLITLEKMIDVFAATGRINYAKSARIYLQSMLDLPQDYPWLYKKLAIEGFNFINRSEQSWSGLWQDLVIEQV